MGNIIRQSVAAFLLVFILFYSIPSNALSVPPDIKAPSAILIEPVRGQILYEKNSNKQIHVSTMCKLMTALIVIENSKLDFEVTISNESTSIEGSSLLLDVGEKYQVNDLLYAIMMVSANDAAIALAEHVGGSVPKFVDMMNKRAQELNLKDTYFVNPTGLFDEAQHTTAHDMAVMLNFALKNLSFNQFFCTRARPLSGKADTAVLINTNTLLWSYPGANGGKTGYNNKDQQTVITSATRNGFRLISILLDSPENSMFTDSASLLDYCFNNFNIGILVEKNTPLKTINVGSTPLNLVSTNDVYYTYPVGESNIKSIEFSVEEKIQLPVTKNRILGTVRYLLTDGTMIDISLYPEKEIIPPARTYTVIYKKITENKDIYYLLILLAALEVLLFIRTVLRLLVYLFRKIFRIQKHL